MSEGHRQPSAFIIGEPDAKAPVAGKRKPRAITGISFPPEGSLGELAVLPPAPPQPSRRTRWGTLLAGSLAGLAGLWASLSITRLVEDFFTRSPVLGWLALTLAGLAVLSLTAMIAREIWSYARLSKIERVQADAAHALNFDDAAAAERTVTGLAALNRHRADARWGLHTLARHKADILDPRDRVKLAERYLVSPRDAEAHRLIARTARRVTLLTTVTPAAAFDMLFVAALNLRLLRELATLYGGRPSLIATFRLARMVVSHLAVTGGLALSDNLLQHVVGKGLLGRLSARFGEGAVNGIMTARIGIAARDVCRPIPQEAAAKETLGNLLRELVSTGKAQEAPP